MSRRSVNALKELVLSQPLRTDSLFTLTMCQMDGSPARAVQWRPIMGSMRPEGRASYRLRCPKPGRTSTPTRWRGSCARPCRFVTGWTSWRTRRRIPASPSSASNFPPRYPGPLSVITRSTVRPSPAKKRGAAHERCAGALALDGKQLSVGDPLRSLSTTQRKDRPAPRNEP